MTLPIAYEARLAECGSKHQAMYQALRDAIAGGLLPPGAKLPSTREMAKRYGLSRGSVRLAYEMLASEGYVRAGVGQGTFAAGQPGLTPDRGFRLEAAEPALSEWALRIRSEAAARRRAEEEEDAEFPGKCADDAVSFVPRNIGARWFPWAEWRQALSCVWRDLGSRFGERAACAAGDEHLRSALAGRLRRERGIRCDAEHIVLTGGSMQAIALIAQLLLESGKTAALEHPGFSGICHAVRATGARLIAAEVDDGGIVPRDWDADVLFVSPARQYPTGAVLSYERRLAVLEWASRRGAWIVEDDYDSDFRWGGRPIEPLKALDREGRVVYIGTFSRLLRPEIRIGYAVVPPALRDVYAEAKRLYEPYPTALTEQRALALWMSQGGYDRHLRRMRRIYGKLERTLREGLNGQLGDWFRPVPSDAGLHVYAVWRRDKASYDRLRQACKQHGVEWKDAGVYHWEERGQPPSAIFGFAHLTEEQIREGIARIRKAADSLGFA